MTEPSWLERARHGHRRVVIATALALVVLAPQPSGSQLVWLAALAALLAVPHGAIDHILAQRILAPRLGDAAGPVGVAGYLALAAAVLAVWLAWPQLGLAGFLALSVWHFGTGDVAPDSPGGGAARHAFAAVHGAVPVVVPSLFWPTEVTRVYNLLLPAEAALAQSTVRAIAAVALAAVLVVAALVMARRPHAAALAGPAGWSLVFVVLPPLVAFALYFCAWHSIRHTLSLAALLDPADAVRGLARFVRLAAPLTAVTLTAAAAAALHLASSGAAPERATASVMFVGLSALTVPHMVVTTLADRMPLRGLERTTS